MEPNRVLRSRHVAQRGARAPAFGDVGEASVSWLSNILTSRFGAGSFLRSSSLNLYSGGMVFSSTPTSTPFSFFCFSSWEWKRELTSASCLNGSSFREKLETKARDLTWHGCSPRQCPRVGALAARVLVHLLATCRRGRSVHPETWSHPGGRKRKTTSQCHFKHWLFFFENVSNKKKKKERRPLLIRLD